MATPLVTYAPDPFLEKTYPALIHALKARYGLNRKYVTREQASNRLLSFLTQNYKIQNAGYTGMTDPEKAGAPQHDFSFLIIRDPRLDAFMFNAPGAFGNEVVVFFDDPAELEKIHSGDVLEVPTGTYQLTSTMTGFALTPMAVKTQKPPILEPGLIEGLKMDMETFFEREDFYKENGIPHKRGILMIGDPGTGKTSQIKYFLSLIQEKYAIVIDCANMYFGPGLFHYIKSVFGSRPKVLVLEDLDGAVADWSARSAFLNFIDGPRELENTLIVGTTNYPQRLDAAILDRPSRFDQIYYVGKPNSELRKQFLLRWFPGLETEQDRLNALVEATDGFTGAFFKEMFTLTGLKDCSPEEALHVINERKAMLKKFEQGRYGNLDEIMRAPDAQAVAPTGMMMAASRNVMLDYTIEAAFARKLLKA